MFKRIFTFLIFTTFIVFGIFAVRSFLEADKEIKSSPKTSSAKPTPIPVNPAASEIELLSKIANLFSAANPDIEYGIFVYSLKTGRNFGFNEVGARHAASVSKILTATYLLKNVEDGKVKLNDKMGTYNVEFNLKQLVNQSNNISWNMIDDLLGVEPQNEFAKSIGLSTFELRENTLSPKEAAMLFIKIYKDGLLNESSRRRLFSYMQNTETENLIPPAIPEDIPLYHKTGMFEGEVHDVAIIDHPTNPFVLSIFTANKLYPDYEGRAQLIQKVASEVYAYMTK
ncbi:serine hydrolase [Candidatus Microgenomates bacterium]|nr:serine hydrolase [Candidatus Microgenomates bacterium]